ncbi:hypothetical protein [Cupriavidus pinatubonensis]|uniref:ATP dependent DNA ligase n=1 Tax=Cupriavidus pinatubonensis TaxID=248026 RepID=UPI0036138F7A
MGRLLLAVNEEGRLRYAGSVGTGWDSKTAAALRTKLMKLSIDTAPIAPATIRDSRWGPNRTSAPSWVKPRLVAEVEFAEWTPSGHSPSGSYLTHVRATSTHTASAARPAADVRSPLAPMNPTSTNLPSKSPLSRPTKASSSRPSCRPALFLCRFPLKVGLENARISWFKPVAAHSDFR